MTPLFLRKKINLVTLHYVSLTIEWLKAVVDNLLDVDVTMQDLI